MKDKYILKRLDFNDSSSEDSSLVISCMKCVFKNDIFSSCSRPGDVPLCYPKEIDFIESLSYYYIRNQYNIDKIDIL